MIAKINVTKRSGQIAELNIDKIHAVIENACKNISNVSVSEIEIKSQLQFYDKIKTRDIQETIIKAAGDLITEETPNYQYVAGRLANYQLRKDVYGQYNPIPLYDHVCKVIREGFYTKDLLSWYSKDEFEQMESFVDHAKDETMAYAAIEQFRSKYLVKNRVTGKIYETPQYAYVLIAATLFHSYPNTTRMKYVKDYYDMLSDNWISPPTPVLADVRTNQRQFSSCVLIDTDDSLDSITEANRSIVKYVSQRAGIGLNVGRIRSKGSPIRNGDTYHTGIVQFLKYFYAAVSSVNQGSIRKGSATFNYPIFHKEFEDLIVLKNNKGIDENRIRHVDYCVQLNRLFYERLLTGGNITFFCPNDVPEVYQYFFSDYDRFVKEYTKAENDSTIKKTVISAIEVFTQIIQERKDTGRIYIMNVDNCNIHSAFLEKQYPVKMTNLCVEITQYTEPVSLKDEGLIALCTLSAINIGKINNPDQFAKPCDLAVRALDALLSYQNYPMKQAENHTKQWRPLGIGITNLAYWLAKNGLTYAEDSDTLAKIDEYMEAFAYYCTKTSIDLAREYQPCENSQGTKYHNGIFPIDTYNKNVDELVKRKPTYDWDLLRNAAKEHGIRNATLLAQMPCESASVTINSTNGIEPIRSLITYKQSKEAILAQVAPEMLKLKHKYDKLWELSSCKGYLQIVAVMQKWMDQSISANTFYNPTHYENNEIPMSVLLSDIVSHFRYGGKTLYYSQVYDGQGEIDVNDEKGCAGGGCTL